MLKRALLFLLLLTACARAGEPQHAIPLLGHGLTDRDGQAIGRIVDVLIGPDAKPLAVIADIGGFLGVGARRVAIDWALLRLRPTGDDWDIAVEATAIAIAAAPDYDGGARNIPVPRVAP